MAFQQQPEEDVSGRSLSRGLWFARNRDSIKRTGIIAFVLFDIICVGIVLVMTFSWVTHISQTQQIFENMALSGLSTVNRVTPEPVTYTQSTTRRRDEESVDALVQITNPNTRFAAELTFEFVLGGQSLNQRTITLAPEQTFYAAAVRVPSPGDTTPSAEIRTVDVQWKRLVDSSVLPEENWQVGDVSFSVVRLAQDQQQEVSRLLMTLTNQSSFGFVEPEVVVVLKDAGSNIVALNTASINEIASFESQELLFQWPDRLPGSLSADVHVNVNRVDPTKRIVTRELQERNDTIDEE
jgi:hypothetical protein